MERLVVVLFAKLYDVLIFFLFLNNNNIVSSNQGFIECMKVWSMKKQNRVHWTNVSSDQGGKKWAV